MPTIDEMKAEVDMISVGTMALNPKSLIDFEDAKGKIVLFVRDGEDGRSMFMGVEMYGVLDRLYEVDYDTWAGVAARMAGEVIMSDALDPFTALLQNGDSQ